MGDEVYNRLMTIMKKNKFGFHTAIASDFDSFLDVLLNERFINGVTQYQDDQYTLPEIDDMESGLNGDFANTDIQHLMHDKSSHDHAGFKSLMNPDRVGTNYPKGDALSCYKILPKGQMPRV